MPEIMPDLSQVESGNIEPGVYPARIATATSGTSQAGNAKVTVEFECDLGNGVKKTRKSDIPITGKGAFKWAQLLRATGFADLAAKYEAGEKVPFNTDNLIDQNLNVEISPGQAKDEGGFWDEVKKYIKV